MLGLDHTSTERALMFLSLQV